MKKLYSMMLAVVASLMMTSCVDDDVERSIYISGSWKGNLNMYYGFEDHRGNYYEFDACSSDIVFYPDYDYATHGYGKEVDWYDEGPYERRYYRFDWEIINGVIYLDYPYDPELNTAIYDYYMDYDYFTGYFDGSKHKFRLRKISDYYDWSCYYDDYMGWHSSKYDYWYSRSRAASAESESEVESGSADTTAAEGKVVKHGRRLPE